MVRPAGPSASSTSSLADDDAAAGHGAPAQHAAPSHTVATPNAQPHASSSEAPQQTSSNDANAEHLAVPELAQPPAVRNPAEVLSQARIPGFQPSDAQVQLTPASTESGNQIERNHVILGPVSTGSKGTLEAMQQTGQGPAADISKDGQFANVPSAAEAPGASKAPSRAPDQPDRMALLARLPLDQLSIDEAAAPETPPPKETVTVVQQTDVFVTSEHHSDLAAKLQLLPLDPKGVLKPAAIPNMPDAKDLAIPPGQSTGFDDHCKLEVNK